MIEIFAGITILKFILGVGASVFFIWFIKMISNTNENKNK